MELLDQYEHGNPAAAGAFAGVIHVESVKDALHAEGERWIEAAGPKEIPRRRLVAATFALETARAGLDYEWTNSVELIDWGWSQLSKQRPPLPAERLWHLAAIALFEGAYDESTARAAPETLQVQIPERATDPARRRLVARGAWGHSRIPAAAARKAGRRWRHGQQHQRRVHESARQFRRGGCRRS